jgi:hypothetical protein
MHAEENVIFLDNMTPGPYIQRMDDELRQALEAMETRMEAVETRILERVEATETKLLKAFLGWGQTIDLKMKAFPLIEERMSVMEGRLGDLERKLLERGM